MMENVATGILGQVNAANQNATAQRRKGTFGEASITNSSLIAVNTKNK